MKHRLLFFLVACIMAVSGFSAVPYSLNESFESGIPSSWSQEVVNTSVGGAWILDDQSTNPAGAYDGDKRVALRASQGNVGYCVRLVTPAIDLSSVAEPQLSFAYAQPRRGNSTNGYSCDTLSVYYRLSSAADWVLIRKYENYQNAWSLQTIDLPAACRVATCQLAFEAKENGGYGVILDRVHVFPKSQCVNAEITGVTLGANAARINWQSIPGRTFELIVSSTAIPDLSNYDTSSAIFYSNSITGTGQIVSNLAPSTHYYAYLRTDCDDNESGHTNWVTTEFSTAIGIPYNPNLAAIPSSWTQKIGATATSVVGSSLSDNNTSYYKWNETSNTTVFGVAHLYAQNYPSSPSWLITPSIDLSGISSGKSALLSFKLALTDGATSASEISSASSSNFYVYASMDEGATWSILRAITGEELTNTGHTFNILLDEFIDAGAISLAFVADAPSTSAYFHFANMSISESDGTCLGLHGLKANSTAHSINLSWSVIGTTNSAVAVLSSHADFSDTIAVQSVSTSSASFSGLDAATMYYVSVRQDCEGSEALIASVTTAFVIPFSENFNSLSSGIPVGWDNSESTGSYVWEMCATGHEGNCVRFNSYYNYSGNTGILALPAVLLDKDADLIFWWKNPTGGAGEVFISDDGGATRTLLKSNLTGVSDWTKYTIDLSAYIDKTVIIYFKGTSNYGNGDAYLYLDDVQIVVQPDCKKVQNVAVGSIETSSAEVSFNYNGAAEYDMLVVTKQMNPDTLTATDFIAFRDTVTNNTVAVSGLASASTFYVYIRALCGGEERGEWSEVKSFKTECEAFALPYVEGFENFASNADPDCWTIVRAGGTYPTVIANGYSTYSNNGSKAFTWGTYSTSSTQYKSYAVMPEVNDPVNTLEMDFYIKFVSATISDRLLVGVMTAPDDTASFVQVASIVPSSLEYVHEHVDFSTYKGNGKYIAFVRVPVGVPTSYSTYYYPFSIDDITLDVIPTCDRMGEVSLLKATSNSATLRYLATNASQYQIVVATDSIDPKIAATAPEVVYNNLVYGTSPVIPNLNANTRYYVYVRGFCGGNDYSAWSKVLCFKTACSAIAPADIAVESFQSEESVDCWTFGFNTLGTSTESAYAYRDSTKAYGAYIKLSKESVAYKLNAAGVDTVYSDGAYAISPELEVTDIRQYQVSFNAATNNSSALNYKRLNVGIVTAPNDRSSIEVIKTIDLDYAADSTQLKSYTISFANYQGDYMGEYGRYVIFQLNEASKHDSTNYVLIDNVSFEPAIPCEQLVETNVDSVGIDGVHISWENISAPEYQVMIAAESSLRPDTISNPISLNKVTENKVECSGLNSNTNYYAYVRAICGAGDTAKWSNAIAFRTSVAIPYIETFGANLQTEGWKPRYFYSYSLADSIKPSAFVESTSEDMWGTTSLALPSGMSGYAAFFESTHYATTAWLISPVIDMTANANDNVEITFKMAGSNLYPDGYVALYISVNGGAYKPMMSWKSSGGTFALNEITPEDSLWTVNLTKYAGKRISLAFGTYQNYSSSAPRLLIDDIDIHTYDAICRGVENVSVAPLVESAKVMWAIEGTPAKAAIEISTTSDFAICDSVAVENAYEHTFIGLTPSTTYYVRVKQLDCANAEWMSTSFTTDCLPIAVLPWSEGFENYEGTAYNATTANIPNCWKASATNSSNIEPHVIGGTGSYVYKHSGSNALTFYGSGNCYAVLPRFEAALNTLQINFWMQTESASNGSLVLGYITDNDVDMNSFDTIAVYPNSSGMMTQHETNLSVVPDSAARLVFRWYYNSQWSCCIDDITLDILPDCPNLKGLNVDNIVSDSARIFVDNSGAHGTHFVVSAVEIDVDTLAKINPSKLVFNDTIVGDTTAYVTGLKPMTQYFVYARHICGGDKVGAWSDPIVFLSACRAITIAGGNPYVENFNSLTSGIPNCWDNSHGTTTNESYKWNYYVSGHEGSCLRFDSYMNRSNQTDTLALPDLFLADDATLSFYWKNPNGGVCEVLISDDGGTTKTVLESNLTGISSWKLYEKDLSAYTGKTVNIYFASTSNWGSEDAYHYLDDVKVRAISSCSSVAGVIIDSISKDNARIRFNRNGTATYNIAVTTAQLDMYHLTAADSLKIAFAANAIADTVHFIEALQPATTYYAYVRSVCDDTSFSEWTSSVSFLTECADVMFDAATGWSEHFSDYKPAGVPLCWDNSEGTTTPVPSKWIYYATSQDTCVRFNSSNNPDGKTNILATPTFVLTTDAMLSFRWKNPAGGAGEVLISKDGGATKISLESNMTNVQDWRIYDIALSDYTGDTVVIYFKGTSNHGSGDAYLYLDDVAITKALACRKVQNAVVDQIKKSSALLTYTPNGATEYEVLVANAAINPDTLANVGASLIAFRDTVSNDTANIAGLRPLTPYFAYVRALCGNEERGAWSDMVAFITDCEEISIAPETPWIEGFENLSKGAAGGDAPQCWAQIPENSVQPYSYVNDASTYVKSGSKSLYFGSSNLKGIYDILPIFDQPLNNLQIEFSYKHESVGSSGLLSVGYITDITDSTTFVSIYDCPMSDVWKTVEVGFEDVPETVVGSARMAFRYGRSSAVASWYLGIDDIKVSIMPQCGDIKDLTVKNIMATSATAQFARSNADKYEVAVTSANINPSLLANAPASLFAFRDTVSTNEVEIAGLTPSKDYYVYVRGLCSETETGAWTSTQFTTRCLASLPYAENFDDSFDRKAVYTGTSSYSIPTCWNEGYISTSNISYIQDNTSSAVYAYSGTAAMRLYSSTSNYSYLVLPEVDAALDTLQLTFKVRAMYQGSNSVTNYASSSYAHAVKIGTMTDPNNRSSFQLLETYVLQQVDSIASSADSYWEDVTVYLQGASGKCIVLLSDFSKDNYVWIDEVEVSGAPACIAPSLLNAKVNAHSVDLTWASTAADFEVAFGNAGFALLDGADSIYNVSGTKELHVDNLESATDYEFYVRAVCGDSLYSSWSKVKAFAVGAPTPYSDDFETGNQWTFVNGSLINAWAWGTATANGGTHAMYISNDNGISNAYTTSSASALVFATKAFHFEEDGDYIFQYDWNAKGENDYDYLRVALVPSDLELTEVSGLDKSSLPSEWIALDGGSQLSQSSSWRTFKTSEISLNGTYKVVFAWRNDASGGGNPPAAIDNFSILKITCPVPSAPRIEGITSQTAVVRIDTIAPAYQIALIHGADTTKQMVAACDSLLLENLTPATQYRVQLRAFCSANDSSDWSDPVLFTTECVAMTVFPWEDNFDGITGSSSEHVLPICWNSVNTSTAKGSYYDYYYGYVNYDYTIYPTVYNVSKYASSGTNALLLYSGYGEDNGYNFISYDPQDQYAVLPEMENVSALRVKLYARSINASTDATFSVGVMSNPADPATFVTVATKTPTSTTYELFDIPLYKYSGDGKYIAIKVDAADEAHYYRGLFIDDVRVEELDINCLGVDNLSLSNISQNGVRLDFHFIDGLEHDAQVAISKEAAFDESTALMVAAISDSTYMFNIPLEEKTTYYVYVRQDCGDGEFSEWKRISFVGPHMIRYEAEFNSTTLSSEWLRYVGMVDEVLAGTSSLVPTTAGWNTTDADTVLNAVHLRSNIYTSSYYAYSSNHWIVSPTVVLNAPAGADIQLSFDAGLVPYSSSTADKRNSGDDDRFVVLVSADNGESWNKLAEWNNKGSQLVFNDLPEHAKTYSVNLGSYAGKSVRVAFYGESTEENADNYLHIGNIAINRIFTKTYEETICDGSDYIGSEHNNSFYIAAEDYHIGANTYEKYVPAPIGIGIPDSVYVLNLTVITSGAFEETVTICEGEHYNATLHGGLFDFDAVLGMQNRVLYVQNEYGCEDIVKLNITVLPKTESHVYDTIAQGDEYEWHGTKYISATIATFDTLSLTTGCDSTVYLHLHVIPKDEAINNVSAQSLLIAPNPVKAGEPIRILTSFSADELAEAKIEIVSTSGALFYAQDGAEDPFVLPGIPVGGVYIVRIVVRDRIFISSLLVH